MAVVVPVKPLLLHWDPSLRLQSRGAPAWALGVLGGPAGAAGTGGEDVHDWRHDYALVEGRDARVWEGPDAPRPARARTRTWLHTCRRPRPYPPPYARKPKGRVLTADLGEG